MKILYIHSAYRPNDLIGNWFARTKEYCRSKNGDAWFAIKFTHRDVQKDDIVVGGSLSCGVHNKIYQVCGLQDMFSCSATKRFLRKVDEIRPDIIHCHVVNDCFLNMGLFAQYVNRHNIKVVWTFHDARVLTGQCPCPLYNGCTEWKSSCKSCPKGEKFLYPENAKINLVALVHRYRKHTIGGINNLTVVTPSRWMASLVAQSYLKDKQCVVINNGINLNVFRPRPCGVRRKMEIPDDAKMLLSVGNPISRLKGMEYLLRLADDLPTNHWLVLVGCAQNDLQLFNSKDRVKAFARVDRDELIAFYSEADLFVNPTLADNFPTVNLEAQACGCPVVAFDSDGTRETIGGKGVVVERGNYDALYQAIVDFDYLDSNEQAMSFASEYNQEKCVNEYIRLYNSLV